MPLSEDEQRILQDIERNFYEQDPSFARAVGHPPSYEHASRNCKLAAVGFAVGMAIVIGTFTRGPVIAFVGFLVMLGAAAVFVTNVKRIGEGRALTEDPSDSTPSNVTPLQPPRRKPAGLDALWKKLRRK